MRLGLLVCLLWLSACAVSEPATLELPPLALSTPAEVPVAGSCDDTQVLESWLQTVSFQYAEFRSLLDGLTSYSDEARDALYTDVRQMGDLRDVVVTTPAPDCTIAALNLLLPTMNDTLIALESYVNGGEVDLGEVLAEAEREFAPFEAEQAALSSRLEQQYQTPQA